MKCKDMCSSRIKVSLTPLGLSEKDVGLKQVTSLADGSNEFIFKKVLPGKYKLEVSLAQCNNDPETSTVSN